MKKINRILVEIADGNAVTRDCFLENEEREAVEHYQRMFWFYACCPDMAVKLIYEWAG